MLSLREPLIKEPLLPPANVSYISFIQVSLHSQVSFASLLLRPQQLVQISLRAIS